jgi:hypothetical protein
MLAARVWPRHPLTQLDLAAEEFIDLPTRRLATVLTD